MNFTKMQGLGNDYVYIDCFVEKVVNPVELAITISDRHFGVGSDGLILILPSDKAEADVQMRMFNADGSESPMCGNGIRCVAKYVYEHQICCNPQMSIDTLSGIKQLQLTIIADKVTDVRVDMGEPELNPELIPIQLHSGIAKTKIVAEPIEVNNDHHYQFTGVSMGNPHCVIFVPQITDAMVLNDGAALELSALFPNKTNVEFVTINSPTDITMRVWERGSGETLACGTGACASVVAAVLNRLTENKVTVHLRGGNLLVEWDPAGNHVYMTGPAVEVFQGVWSQSKA
ncbi:MAG TPA: diaminopimelate epimerase [Firmicutes bacterium]|jgi:diaminopimelate epimerase|nr:diaminopimelate epimerase [Bacillota bacterium]